jgi:tRNA dimethylallyltransferase
MQKLKLKAPEQKKKVIFLIGPTAIGKTRVAVELAKKIHAEIISCDSMQVYRRMNIISQKPPKELRKRIRHHLIDMIPPQKDYNVADYQKQAILKIKGILKKNRIPLLVGGTGFYMHVLLDGIFEEGSQNKKIRNRLYAQAKRLGKQRFYKRLMKVDPQAAAKIHSHDLRRIIRALEVYINTGMPISELQKQKKGIVQDYAVQIFGLNIQRRQLYKRIDQRVDEMFEQGLVGEVKRLLKLKISPTASQAIGIKEIKGYLEGEYDLEETRRLIKRNSRRFAKRQLSWFRRDGRVCWVNIKHTEKAQEIALRILSLLGQ